MTPDDLAPTPELLAAVQVERVRLQAVVDELSAARDDLVEQLEDVEARLRLAVSRHRQLGHVLGEDDEQPPLWQPDIGEVLAGRPARHEDDRLRGAAIRHAAVRAALADPDPGRPRHYREWLDLVEHHAGRKVDGRDPAATLLTQLSRCPLIVRAPEAGTYRLDADALVRLERRRDDLRAAAAAKVSAAAHRPDSDPIDLARQLARVDVEVRRMERELHDVVNLVDALGVEGFFNVPSEMGAVARVRA